MGSKSDHVPFFAVPLIALAVGFVVAWGLAALSLLAAVLAYGLFGLSLEPLSLRLISLAFSIAFLGITGLGWASWVLTRLSKEPDHG